jgi:hypothetical protein
MAEEEFSRLTSKQRVPEAPSGTTSGASTTNLSTTTSPGAGTTSTTLPVCHYPPGTSKWNKIEHRMFSFITINWRGRPLTTMRTIIELISATSTSTGLSVQADYDPGWYPTGVKISDKQLAALPLDPHQFHGEWNYTIGAQSVPA